MRIAERIGVLRQRKPGWEPDWELRVSVDGAPEQSLNGLLKESGLPPLLDWAVESRRGFGRIESSTIESPSGAIWDQPLFAITGAASRGAVIVPWFLTERLYVGLLTEFRPILFAAGTRGRTMAAFPRGNAERGESDLEAAARELAEETQLSPRRFERIGEVISDTAWVPQPVAVFAAEVEPPSALVVETPPHEGIAALSWTPLSSAIESDISCGFTLSAMALFIRHAVSRGLVSLT
ncbi:MAG: NUDIX domain-containing protein [Dehalococcoidia bacterium]|nr:NUDIX domain-containing protein [Dehalococcoidia bacterium]